MCMCVPAHAGRGGKPEGTDDTDNDEMGEGMEGY